MQLRAISSHDPDESYEHHSNMGAQGSEVRNSARKERGSFLLLSHPPPPAPTDATPRRQAVACEGAPLPSQRRPRITHIAAAGAELDRVSRLRISRRRRRSRFENPNASARCRENREPDCKKMLGRICGPTFDRPRSVSLLGAFPRHAPDAFAADPDCADEPHRSGTTPKPNSVAMHGARHSGAEFGQHRARFWQNVGHIWRKLDTHVGQQRPKLVTLGPMLSALFSNLVEILAN